MVADNRRQRNRDLVAKYKRGKVCVNCEELKSLTFHHQDPSKKFFDLSKASRQKVSLGALKREIDKCVLLCEDCHKLEHEEIILVPNGWPPEDFSFSTLTNVPNSVIITHEATGTRIVGTHGISRRVAHNQAWGLMEHKVGWYYQSIVKGSLHGH